MTVSCPNGKVLSGAWLPVTAAKLACLALAVSCCGCVTISIPPLPFLKSAQSQDSSVCRKCGHEQRRAACNCTEQVQSNVVVSHTHTTLEPDKVASQAAETSQAVETSQAEFSEPIQTGPVPAATSDGEWTPALRSEPRASTDTPTLYSIPPVTEGCESEISESAAVSEIETQLSELTLRMEQLEEQRVQNQLTIKQLRESQNTEAYERTQLMNEVSQWKSSVQELRSRVRIQQQNDIDSLTAISKTLARLTPEATDTKKEAEHAPEP